MSRSEQELSDAWYMPRVSVSDAIKWKNVCSSWPKGCIMWGNGVLRVALLLAGELGYAVLIHKLVGAAATATAARSSNISAAVQNDLNGG
jgi:hypothetical protein